MKVITKWKAGAATVFAAALLVSAPAQAQFSAGYKFLEAVRKKEGADVEKALSDPGSNVVNARDISSGETALHIVAKRRDVTWLRFLIGKGADVNARDDHGIAPIHVATSLGWRDGVAVLLGAGAQVNVPNDAGETPLIVATHRRDLQIMKLLLEKGANPDRADNSGRTARDFALLDGKNSPTLQAIEAVASEKVKKDAGPVYGPSF
jgi:uncharacterized protein